MRNLGHWVRALEGVFWSRSAMVPKSLTFGGGPWSEGAVPGEMTWRGIYFFLILPLSLIPSHCGLHSTVIIPMLFLPWSQLTVE